MTSPPETPHRIEPCLLDEYPVELADLVGAVLGRSATLGARLHPDTAASLAGLVRVMSCYYSNLIEGHNTRPRDIERALSDELDNTRERRDLQIEARAHINVQAELDSLHATGRLGEPASQELVRHLHRAFYAAVPERMLRIQRGRSSFRMVPGEFRTRPEHDNVVGRHHPPSSRAVGAFMEHFASRYALAPLGPSGKVVAMAAAHHRFNYIHPFPDGNGRVSRLMSHAMALFAGIGAHGLWSISRGLARGLEDAGEYKRMMDLADTPRRGELDGRGNLSREALVEFCVWFARVSVDQLEFMGGLFQLDALKDRLQEYVTATLGAPEGAARLATEALHRGELPRGEAARIVGAPERTARDYLRHLTDSGLLASRTPKGPVALRFGVRSAEILFPRLFPAQLDAG